MNNYDPKKIADTTTPRAAATTLNYILTHSNMHKGNLQFLKELMIENETGDSLIKAPALTFVVLIHNHLADVILI